MSAAVSRRRLLKLAGGAAAALGVAAAADRDALGEATAAPARSAVPARAGASAASRAATTVRRFSAWSAAPSFPDASGRSATGFHDALVRMVVRPTLGGTRPRIRLSNRYGTAPLHVSHAWISVRAEGPEEEPGTRTAVTFGGRAGAVVPAGSDLVSDAVAVPFAVVPEAALLVTLQVAGATGPTTWHARSRDAGYVMDGAARLARGARLPRTATRRWSRLDGWFWLCGLDLLSGSAAGTVVCFGDSITDGPPTPRGASSVRWPDLLADRIARARPRSPYGVVDLGIAGNRLLRSAKPAGAAALDRFGTDVLAQQGATDVILLEGINDIGAGTDSYGRPVTASELIDAQRRLIGQARSAGLAVHGATLLPFEGAKYYTLQGERVRQQLNQWIRTGGEYDSVVDFDRAVRDLRQPTRYAVPYDSGDHLHPSDAGQAALAAAVDLRALQAPRV
ncbi:GDSL-type esterase/lipase family protein [Streptacidiphilus sp. ASG 303]|uniref:GDSL-type esterase/lipase family protein n=1 Tax=Streptacidiphilus sp. ASG 303 TaxID=2896847 RepID=UPI001E576BDB|nr:GDSL-type esterase/lipase family protein [Streptacidiphilus sp. ASG 303]MCD0483161.1 GDSL-type esterase/lipase family protein [Streptacidiphilus sp. ASG 303]